MCVYMQCYGTYKHNNHVYKVLLFDEINHKRVNVYILKSRWKLLFCVYIMMWFMQANGWPQQNRSRSIRERITTHLISNVPQPSTLYNIVIFPFPCLIINYVRYCVETKRINWCSVLLLLLLNIFFFSLCCALHWNQLIENANQISYEIEIHLLSSCVSSCMQVLMHIAIAFTKWLTHKTILWTERKITSKDIKFLSFGHGGVI